MHSDDIKKMFDMEVREKKRTGNGIHSKTGVRGYVGKMRFPTDTMSRKEKYNYRKAGKVIVSIVKEEIMSLEDFYNLSDTEKKNVLTRYRNKFTNKEISSVWGIGHNKYYKIINELNLPVAARGGATVSPEKRKLMNERALESKKNKRAEKEQQLVLLKEQQHQQVLEEQKAIAEQREKEALQQQLILQQQQQNLIVEPLQKVSQTFSIDGLALQFKGVGKADIIIKKLDKLKLLLDAEISDFEFEIRILEKV